MPNYLPYLILVLISLTLLAIMMLYKRQFGLVILFLSYSGMVYVAEFLVMVLWNSYEYYPEVLHIPYYDNIAGAIVSNLLIIPSLGTLVAMYRLRWAWMIVIAACLAGMEWIFTELEIYEPHWWKKMYTWMALSFFFFLARFWLSGLQRDLGFFRYMSLWMQAWGVVGTVMYVMSVLGLRYYQIGYFEDMYRDDIFTSAMMGVLKAGVFSTFITCFKKVRWRLLAPVLVFALDIPLYCMGWLMVNIPFWIYTMIYLVLASLLLGWTSYAHRYLSRLVD
ncbi:hypothetical protein [Marinicrinis lubricantis]|uniref:Uncharacterized protein n=1 Tax=Marinicrinis lubricantis TaxID=2086470 RepID=A0ABW1ISS6_9BACL